MVRVQNLNLWGKEKDFCSGPIQEKKCIYSPCLPGHTLVDGNSWNLVGPDSPCEPGEQLRAGGAAESKPRTWQLFGGEMDVMGPELSSLKSYCSVFCCFFNFLF